MQIPKWLIAIAGILFLVLIVAVAFFVGRQSSGPLAAGMAVQAVPQTVPAPKDLPGDLTGEASKLPTAALSGTPAPSGDPTPSNSFAPGDSPAPRSTLAPSGGPGPGSTLAPSGGPGPSPASGTLPVTPEARARVETYFKQMEMIRSGGATNDTQDFATKLLSSAVSGDLSGFDDLVRAASDAQRRAGELTPPPERTEYHRQAVTLLGDSKTMIVALRDGLTRSDTNAVAAAGASAQSMQIRAESLAQAEKALRKRYGL